MEDHAKKQMLLPCSFFRQKKIAGNPLHRMSMPTPAFPVLQNPKAGVSG
jgi:hypothetical protein